MCFLYVVNKEYVRTLLDVTSYVLCTVCCKLFLLCWTEAHAWIGYWGKHMKAAGFKSVKEYQKVTWIFTTLIVVVADVLLWFCCGKWLTCFLLFVLFPYVHPVAPKEFRPLQRRHFSVERGGACRCPWKCCGSWTVCRLQSIKMSTCLLPALSQTLSQHFM